MYDKDFVEMANNAELAEQCKVKYEVLPKAGTIDIPEDEIAKIDILMDSLTKGNLSEINKLREAFAKSNPSYAKATVEDKFCALGVHFYCYALARYNSKTRGLKMAGIIMGQSISGAYVKKICERNKDVADMIENAEQRFRDTLREEMYRRAVEGEDTPVFDKTGVQVDTIKKKNSKLFEVMIKANCEEYKEKNTAVGIAGNNITFQVVNFLQENE